jgi:hypothetical protein
MTEPSRNDPDAANAPERAQQHASEHAGSLGPALEPALRNAIASLGGQLDPVSWFRPDWQRGGGSTGLTTHTSADGSRAQVVVKLPVGPVELRWTRAAHTAAAELGALHDAPTPRVLASGEHLNGYDIAWIVIERLHGPLASRFSPQDVPDMLRATARWHMLAEHADGPPTTSPAQPPPRGLDYERLIEQSREVCKRSEKIGQGQHWNAQLKAVHRCLPTLLARWNSRPLNTWCHGDLHPGNAMRRATESGAAPTSRGSCVLIDLALVHRGHWIEDALYLERVYWGRSHLLGNASLISTLGAARRELGLPCAGDYGTLANVRRVLAAAAAPALFEREGNIKYLDHALELIHRLLPQVGH